MGAQVLDSLEQSAENPLFSVQNLPISPVGIAQFLLIVGATFLSAHLLVRLLRRTVFKHAAVNVGLQETLTRIVRYLVLLVGGFASLDLLGIDLTAFATLGAVLMVGIGFGLQNVASNFISGLILLFERPIQVGDFVDVAGTHGTVRAVNARSTRIETQDNVSILVPNSSFVSDVVTNWSYRDPRTRIHVPVGVSYGADVEKVRDVLIAVAAANEELLVDPGPQVQFLGFGDSSLNFDLLVWIKDPRRQYFIPSDLNFSIVAAFRREDIEIPFPQRDIHIRSAPGLADATRKDKPRP